MPPRRRCLSCSRPLAKRARADAKYCSNTCRATHWHRRARTSLTLAHKPKCQTCRKRIAFGCRSDARFCSDACKQRAYRGRKTAAATAKPKAHQRLIRERLAAEDVGGPRHVDIGTAQVRPITTAEARAIIEQYEWLGTMSAVARYCFGIDFDGELGGAVVFGDEYGTNLGVWRRYGFDGKIIALLRGACAHWAHPHSASKLTRGAMDLLPARYKVVTATVDSLAGEIGTVYQASGFDYVGTMRAGGRALTRINGRTVSERQMHRLTGTRGARALARLGFDTIPVARRARYFAFLGDKRERERNRGAIAHLIQPYPKRVASSAKNLA